MSEDNCIGSDRIPVFIFTLTSNSLSGFKKAGYSINKLDIYFVKESLSFADRKQLDDAHCLLKNIDFHLFPHKYYSYEAELFNATVRLTNTEFFKNILLKTRDNFISGIEHYTASIIKTITNLIANDYKLIFLAEELSMEKNAVFFVEEKELISEIYLSYKFIDIAKNKTDFIKTVGAFLIVLSKIAFGGRRVESKIKNGIVFDPSYDSLGNPEIPAFYRYLKTRNDVIYLCHNKKSEVGCFLKSEGKQVDVVSWGVSGFQRKIAQLSKIIMLAKSFIFLSCGWHLKFSIVKLRYQELYYLYLFKNLKPKLYLKLRGDIDLHHPLATSLVEQTGGINLGYMHGSYPHISRAFSVVDFHLYGLLGEGFKDYTYKGVWSDMAKYVTMGAITSEQEDSRLSESGRFTVTLFLTSTGKEYHIQDEFHGICLGSFYYAISEMEGSFAVRDKCYKDFNDFYKNCPKNEFSDLYKNCPKDVTFSSHSLEDKRKNLIYSSAKIIMESEIVVVMATTSVAWEALALKKKIIIFQPINIPHPFESIAPQLVVRSKEDLKERLHWLSALSSKEYEEILEPLIATWCKESTGTSVQYLIEESLRLNDKGTLSRVLKESKEE